MEPASANVIVGQSHFIKTVEDLYEAVGRMLHDDS
ncbi:MAG TPA: adenosine-specific kinase [Terriglobales bacterium]|nr:adenosine-specific kinase [Terriglobales bacterium]